MAHKTGIGVPPLGDAISQQFPMPACWWARRPGVSSLSRIPSWIVPRASAFSRSPFQSRRFGVRRSPERRPDTPFMKIGAFASSRGAARRRLTYNSTLARVTCCAEEAGSAG